MRSSWMALFVAVAVLGLVAGVSRADTITTFDASGTFQSGGTLSGTMTVDVTTGVVQSVNFTADSQNYTFIVVQIPNSSDNGDFFLENRVTPSALPDLTFGLSDSTLVGYSGGSIGSLDQSANGYFSDVEFSSSDIDGLVSGNFTVAAPLPSSAWGGLALLGGLGLTTALRRRWSAAA